MATFAKKIHTRGSDSVEYTTNVYSTPSEAGSQYMQIELDGQTGYVPLVGVSDPLATAGRVTFSNGQTWALGKRGPIPYQYQIITASGSWTVPSDVTKIRVTCVGGGAGGVEIHPGQYNVAWLTDADYTPAYMTNPYGRCRYAYYISFRVSGGTTIFGSLSAAGAQVSTACVVFQEKYSGSCPGEILDLGTLLTDSSYMTYRDLASCKQSCGYSCGGVFGDENVYNGPSTPLTGVNGTILGYAGTGGYADLDYYNYEIAMPGGSGHMSGPAYLNVLPGQTMNVSIGAGGPGYRRQSYIYGSYNSDGAGVSQGGNGAVLIEWGVGIE
jgi:hypothetical protein